MSAQIQPQAAADNSIRESSSFAAHLKTIERKIPLRARYENFIGGKWVAPAKGGYFDNVSPTTGRGHRAGGGRGACCGRQVGPHGRRRARQDSQQDCRSHRTVPAVPGG